MGFIREPKGIDFVIKSEPMTEKEKLAFSTFIATRKALNKKKVNRKKASRVLAK
jgi:hypothetical protein